MPYVAFIDKSKFSKDFIKQLSKNTINIISDSQLVPLFTTGEKSTLLDFEIKKNDIPTDHIGFLFDQENQSIKILDHKVSSQSSSDTAVLSNTSLLKLWERVSKIQDDLRVRKPKNYELLIKSAQNIQKKLEDLDSRLPNLSIRQARIWIELYSLDIKSLDINLESKTNHGEMNHIEQDIDTWTKLNQREQEKNIQKFSENVYVYLNGTSVSKEFVKRLSKTNPIVITNKENLKIFCINFEAYNPTPTQLKFIKQKVIASYPLLNIKISGNQFEFTSSENAELFLNALKKLVSEEKSLPRQSLSEFVLEQCKSLFPDYEEASILSVNCHSSSKCDPFSLDSDYYALNSAQKKILETLEKQKQSGKLIFEKNSDVEVGNNKNDPCLSNLKTKTSEGDIVFTIMLKRKKDLITIKSDATPPSAPKWIIQSESGFNNLLDGMEEDLKTSDNDRACNIEKDFEDLIKNQSLPQTTTIQQRIQRISIIIQIRNLNTQLASLNETCQEIKNSEISALKINQILGTLRSNFESLLKIRNVIRTLETKIAEKKIEGKDLFFRNSIKSTLKKLSKLETKHIVIINTFLQLHLIKDTPDNLQNILEVFSILYSSLRQDSCRLPDFPQILAELLNRAPSFICRAVEHGSHLDSEKIKNARKNFRDLLDLQTRYQAEKDREELKSILNIFEQQIAVLQLLNAVENYQKKEASEFSSPNNSFIQTLAKKTEEIFEFFKSLEIGTKKLKNEINILLSHDTNTDIAILKNEFDSFENQSNRMQSVIKQYLDDIDKDWEELNQEYKTQELVDLKTLACEFGNKLKKTFRPDLELSSTIEYINNEINIIHSLWVKLAIKRLDKTQSINKIFLKFYNNANILRIYKIASRNNFLTQEEKELFNKRFNVLNSSIKEAITQFFLNNIDVATSALTTLEDNIRVILSGLELGQSYKESQLVSLNRFYDFSTKEEKGLLKLGKSAQKLRKYIKQPQQYTSKQEGSEPAYNQQTSELKDEDLGEQQNSSNASDSVEALNSEKYIAFELGKDYDFWSFYIFNEVEFFKKHRINQLFSYPSISYDSLQTWENDLSHKSSTLLLEYTVQDSGGDPKDNKRSKETRIQITNVYCRKQIITKSKKNADHSNTLENQNSGVQKNKERPARKENSPNETETIIKEQTSSLRKNSVTRSFTVNFSQFSNIKKINWVVRFILLISLTALIISVPYVAGAIGLTAFLATLAYGGALKIALAWTGVALAEIGLGIYFKFVKGLSLAKSILWSLAFLPAILSVAFFVKLALGLQISNLLYDFFILIAGALMMVCAKLLLDEANFVGTHSKFLIWLGGLIFGDKEFFESTKPKINQTPEQEISTEQKPQPIVNVNARDQEPQSHPSQPQLLQGEQQRQQELNPQLQQEQQLLQESQPKPQKTAEPAASQTGSESPLQNLQVQSTLSRHPNSFFTPQDEAILNNMCSHHTPLSAVETQIQYLASRTYPINSLFQGQTPLHRAATTGQAGICKALVEKGANNDFKDEYGKTPLYYAIKNDKLEAALILISGIKEFDYYFSEDPKNDMVHFLETRTITPTNKEKIKTALIEKRKELEELNQQTKTKPQLVPDALVAS